LAVYDARDGRKLIDDKKHGDAIYAMAFAPDDSLLVTAGGNGNGGDTVCRVWDPATWTLRKELVGHTFPVYGVAVSPDGLRLATASRDKTVRIWTLPAGQSRVIKSHTSDVHRCEFSPDGRWLATASQDATVRIWDSETGKELAKLTGTDPFYGVAFSPDGTKLAAVGDDYRLHVWGTSDWQVVLDEKLSRDALYSVKFWPQGDQVAVAGADTRLRFWSLK
jgi:WD40 repeat protein